MIIQNPNNGEILAMASSGTYDLNNPRDLSGSYTSMKLKTWMMKKQKKLCLICGKITV